MDNIKIINRMISELEQAKDNESKKEVMLKHIENVQLLGSLFLEEEKVESKSDASFLEKEKEMMFGGLSKPKTEQNQSRADIYDDANGDSIFDF